jgi:di/tricarboxylate transporter
LTPPAVVVGVAISTGALVVFAIVVGALVLFATEALPPDVTALGVVVALVLLEPWTGVTPAEGIAGFSSPATITVLAMFVLSDGIQRTGVIHRLGRAIATYTGDDERRQLGATVGLVGPISGFINNTAAVAILLPMVTDLAHRGKTSPSTLLLPLSYASMFGGTLTLIGTSTNILASEVAARLGVPGTPFSMFEFTLLGAALTVVGTVYLMTVGRWLVPARISPRDDLTEEFEMADYLTEVVVREDSPLVGRTVDEGIVASDLDVDVVQLIRGDRRFQEPLGQKTIRAGDVFAVRTARSTLVELADAEGLDLLPEVEVDEDELEASTEAETLVELVVAPGSALLGESLVSTGFRQRYDATVLALRRGPELTRQRMDDVSLRVGDTLLVQATAESIRRLERGRDVIVAGEVERPEHRPKKMPVAVGIVAAVVGTAALGWLDILAASLAGSLAMVLTGCLRPSELYDAVQWDVIFLLAGVIPLGLALESTGGADLLANGLVAVAPSLPPLLVLGLLYLLTALLTNVVSNNASVVLMIPVAVEAAARLDASAFGFVLAVTFAASTAFMTPVGYQTNLMVYGPGGYRFLDYVTVGAPLQLAFAVVTTLGIAAIWGL